MKCPPLVTPAVLVAAAVLVGACATSRPAPQRYDLGDFSATRPASSTLAVKLVIRDVTMPSWLRSSAMLYRLDYALPAHPQRYAGSQWVATPGELITLRLREAVASANRGFTLQSTNGTDGYRLQAALEEFTQVFIEPSKSDCIVQLRASLWKSDQIVAQRAFRIELPAQTPNASGAASCLAAAVNRDLDEVVTWLSNNLAHA